MCTSVETFISFLGDIIGLAERHNDVHFIVRAKNADWLLDSRTATERGAHAVGNVSLDDNYSTLNRTYQLAARSSLIIAKPTSLIDEGARLWHSLRHTRLHAQRLELRQLVAHLPAPAAMGFG